MLANSPTLVQQLIVFSIKAAIAFILFIVAAVVLMPDFSALSYSIKKAAKDEKTRVSLMSFIQNPAALYRAAEIDEKAGKLKDAEMEVELAIGLLEMHNANPVVIKRYTTKLAQLNAQSNTQSIAPSAPVSPPQPPAGTFQGKPVKRWAN